MKTVKKNLKVRRSWVRGERVLEYIFNKEDNRPACFTDVAEALGISPSSASLKLMRLQRRGLLQVTGASRIRPFFYMLTEAGIERLKATT